MLNESITSDNQTYQSSYHVQPVEYRIRQMYHTDIDDVTKIEQMTWPQEAWPAEQFFDHLCTLTCYCWILEDSTQDDSIIGYGLQKIEFGEAHIINFCIHPNYRGRRLGGYLLRYMIDNARKHYCSSIMLEVDVSNINACRLYDRYGFKKVELLENYYASGSNAYTMQLVLFETV